MLKKYIKSLAGDCLALLGGVLLSFSFAPFNYPFLAIFALILLLLTWQQVSPGRAFWRGYLFGLGQFGAGIYWVYFGIYDLGAINAVASAGLSMLLVAYLALYSALTGWITVTAYQNSKMVSLLLVFPATWTLLEWLRGWFLTGFPWLQLGYSQIDTPLSGFVPITGVYGVSWVVTFTAAALLTLFYFRGYRRWGLLAMLLCIWWGAHLLTSVKWTQPLGKPFQATLIQGNIPLQSKWLPKQRDATLNIYKSMTRQHWGSRLIVWPETALPVVYDSLDPQFIHAFKAEARTHHSDILFGVIASGEHANEYYNAMKLWGETTDTYYKRHLVPFGEYSPFQSVTHGIAQLTSFSALEFKSGTNTQQPLVVAGYQISASICYEDVFGQNSLTGLPKAAYIVNISDDGWWRNTSGAHQHLQMARFRALETGRYMLRTTATGITAFINEKGKVVSKLPMFKRAALTGWVVPMVGITPYIRWGDQLIISSCIVSMALAMLLIYLRSRKQRKLNNPKNIS